MKAFSHSILFVNIDSGPQESEWEKYIKVINETDLHERVKVGVLSNNNSKTLVQKYLGELKTEAGYIILRQRTQDVKRAIYNVLMKTEAKGRRKYLRAACQDNGKATFNISFKGTSYSGKIIDISSVGMACYFDDERIVLSVGDTLPDIQLRLIGKITTVGGKIAGIRQDVQRIFVILFDERTPYLAKEKIYSFIHYSLNHNMEKTLQDLSTVQK